jgi:hypothetical protein
VPTVRPTLQRQSGENPHLARRPPDGTQQLVTRVIVSSQARLTVTLRGRGAARATILRQGSRVGTWLRGGAAKSVGAEALTPGGLPVRIRVRAGFLRPGASYRLVVKAVDPYNRKATLVVPVRG